MMTKIFALGLLVTATLAAPALAATNPDALVQSQEKIAQLSPRDGGAVIELAGAYQRAGRAADANTALRRALVLDNAMLETPTGDAVWSHDVARRALAQDATLASR